MSVIVKGMRKSDCCNKCEFHWEEDVSFEIIHQCQVKTGYIDNADIHSFPYDCPLIELPEKHGRLIDADAFAENIKTIIERQRYDDLAIDKLLTVGDVLNAVIADLKGMTPYGYENAPTVIEAEGVDE